MVVITTLPRPRVVLDTNVVFDWLVFNNPQVRPWADAIEGGQLEWVASAAMRDELLHVLGRGVAAEWRPDRARIEAQWARWAQPLEAVDLHGPALRLRCSDADDQKFIDLALGHRVAWLVTRDRALLKLARRARPLGVAVLRPQDQPGTHAAWPEQGVATRGTSHAAMATEPGLGAEAGGACPPPQGDGRAAERG